MRMGLVRMDYPSHGLSAVAEDCRYYVMKQHVNTRTEASLHVTGNQAAAQWKSACVCVYVCVWGTIWIPHALALLL